MASRQEIKDLQLERTSTAIFSPLASTHENTGSHANLHNFIRGEDEAFPCLNTSHGNDNFLKASCHWKLGGDDSKEVQDNGRFFRIAGTVARKNRKSLITTNSHTKSLFNEKENVESGSTRTTLGRCLSKAKAFTAKHKSTAGLLGLTDVRRIQELSNMPFSQRDVNVLDEAGGEIDVSSGNVVPDSDGGCEKEFSEGSQNLHSRGEHGDCLPNKLDCSKPDCSQILIQHTPAALVKNRLQKTSWDAFQSAESLKAPILCPKSDEAPLLSKFDDRSENDIYNDGVRSDSPVLPGQLQNPYEKLHQCSETAKTLEIQCVERGSCELSECSMPSQVNLDHVVVYFSVQKFLQENAARADGNKFLKLSSLCSRYSQMVLCWVTRICREQNITNCLRRIRQLFSPSARGFSRLDSQKLPEFSTKMSSSSKKVPAKDNELRAVLLKINEVLASMEPTSSDSMQNMNTSGATGFSQRG